MTTVSVTTATQEETSGVCLPTVRKMLWPVWGLLLAIGLWGVYHRFTQGHLPAGYGSYVPWGLWVALYFHGVGIAGGVFVFGAGGYVLDWPGFRSRSALRATIILSLAAIIPAFIGVWLDLGHMDRSHYIFTSPSFTSMMTFNAWMYNAFVVLAAIAWVLSYKKETVWLKPVLCAGVMFSILFPSQSGAFFGVVEAKPYWHTALLPILFLTSSITAGAATLLVVRWLMGAMEDNDSLAPPDTDHTAALGTLRIITMLGLIAYFVFEFAELSITMWHPSGHAPAIELVLWGPYWWVFWIIHLLFGLTALGLIATKSRLAWAAGAFIVAVTFISSRLNVLIPGQAVGELDGLQQAFQHDRLTYIYHATFMEYQVGLLLLAVGMAVFYVGYKISSKVASRIAGKA